MARRWALKHKSNLAAVRAMFGDAMRDGLVDVNPFAELRLTGSKGRKDIVVLTEAELHELADLALDKRMELGPEYGYENRPGADGHDPAARAAEAGARARLLAAWDAQTGPTPIERSGAKREQAG
jgi:hypothetical protein